MNIFYASATHKSEPKLTNLVEVIIPKLLQELGDNVYFYHYTPGQNSNYKSFQEINRQITTADVFIGEMSRASQSLGFQLSYAISLTKPCLYLYHESRSGAPDKLMVENPSRLLRIKTYNANNFEQVIRKFVNSAAKQLPSKRTSFMSTKKIDDYVGIKAKESGVSKGEVIRQILDNAASNRLNP